MVQLEHTFPDRKYPSKVLLFGEHTVMMGSGALAMPYQRYHGRWNMREATIYHWWNPFVEFIIDLRLPFLNKDSLEYLKVNGNLCLDIPIGYGLGSSGALTAAVYDFAVSEDVSDLAELQLRLGLMESFFHGRSSGFDPLISYVNTGVRKSFSGDMSLWSPSLLKKVHCYLVDSGSPRVGKEQIAEVQKMATEDSRRFRKIVDLNNQIIASLFDDDQSEKLFNSLNQLSIEQYNKMDFLIVPKIRNLWHSTIDKDNISMKICGAGGGGYYLLFSKEKLSDIEGWELQEVYLRPDK